MLESIFFFFVNVSFPFHSYFIRLLELEKLMFSFLFIPGYLSLTLFGLIRYDHLTYSYCGSHEKK